VARLREAIRRTRAELDERRVRHGRIDARFAAEIRPREEAFTRTVCRLTERLVDHHERTPLADDERTLLGLWVNENLRSLTTHPFAPRAEADGLALRWRRHLGSASHPLDVPLASLYARQSGAAMDEPTSRSARPDPTESVLDDEPPNDRGAGAGSRREDDVIADSTEDGAGGAAGGEPDGGSRSGSGETREAATGERRAPGASDRLVSRLFRRLARVLHPDREPDAGLRREKHRLMSDCLRARAERDVETLLGLYATHVGALPEDLLEEHPATLVALLRRQLDTLRARLRRFSAGDALQRLIVARYGADDPAEIDRRFELHAGALDGEIERVEDLERHIVGIAGLREELAVRRERELDRLAIDELTGASGG